MAAVVVEVLEGAVQYIHTYIYIYIYNNLCVVAAFVDEAHDINYKYICIFNNLCVVILYINKYI